MVGGAAAAAGGNVACSITAACVGGVAAGGVEEYDGGGTDTVGGLEDIAATKGGGTEPAHCRVGLLKRSLLQPYARTNTQNPTCTLIAKGVNDLACQAWLSCAKTR